MGTGDEETSQPGLHGKQSLDKGAEFEKWSREAGRVNERRSVTRKVTEPQRVTALATAAP